MAVDLTRLNAEQLRTVMANARRLNNLEAYNQAFSQLCTMLPGAEAGGDADPISEAFWKAVHAAEEVRPTTNGRTTRLTKLRQKAAKEGVVGIIESVVLKPAAGDGFDALRGAGMPEMLFESIVVDNPDQFSPEAVAASSMRLSQPEPVAA